jgi:methyl acetate hydrolase
MFAAGTLLAGGSMAQDRALEERLDEALRAPVDRGEIAMAAGAITTAEETVYSRAIELWLNLGDAA